MGSIHALFSTGRRESTAQTSFPLFIDNEGGCKGVKKRNFVEEKKRWFLFADFSSFFKVIYSGVAIQFSVGISGRA